MKKKIIISIILIVLVLLGIAFYVINIKNNTSEKSTEEVYDTSTSDGVDWSSYETYEVILDGNLEITKDGVYKITGSISDGLIKINTSGNVKLILNGVKITNSSGPAINVEAAKNVYIELNGENIITSTTTEDLDGAIYSKSDLFLEGDGTLNITSNYDSIVSKDDLTIYNGIYVINSDDDGIRGKDSVTINSGNFTINSNGDAIKSTNETEKGDIVINGGTFNINSTLDGVQSVSNLIINGGEFNIKTIGTNSDESMKALKASSSITITNGTFNLNTTDDAIHANGNITISSGTFTITSKDDGVHADGLIEISGGTFDITATEGLEATYIKINDGTININASDDGINATSKSTDYDVCIEINGGNITIKMGQGDTDALDSNGNLYINGGTLNITANSPFDYDGEAKYTGGTLIVNGTETTTITNQFMGGGQMGGQPNGQAPDQSNMQGGIGRRF